MSRQWPSLPLGKLLIEQKQRIGTFDANGLPLLGVSNHEGLHRSGKPRISDMSRYLRVEKDWFAYNPMRINVGSIGLAQTAEQTGVISPDYVVFSCSDRLLPDLLFSFLKHRRGLQQINAATAGSVRERLYFDKLAKIEFPLPPLTEQRRIVGRVAELSELIEEAIKLRDEARKGVEALLRSLLADDQEAKATAMRELVRLRSPNITVQPDTVYQFAGVYSFGRGVFRAQQKSGMEFSYSRLTELHVGNFVYPKLMAWEGALEIVPAECDKCVVSTEFPVFEVNEERVYSEILDTYFRDPSVWSRLSGASTGTNMRRRRLNPEDFLNHEIRLPSRDTQEKFRSVQARVSNLQNIQRETSIDLAALMPAALDQELAL